MKKSALFLAFGLLVAAQARAEYSLSPTAVITVDQIYDPTFGNTGYNTSSAGTVGQGQGPIQIHLIETLETFDLSGITAPITGATVAGSLTGLRPVDSSFPYVTYATIAGEISLSTQTPPTDPAALFTYISSNSVGLFNVDNGIPPSPDQATVGGQFSDALGNVAVAAIEAARLGGSPIYLGFYSTSVSGEPFGSVEGDLSVSLDIRTVPEPGAATLLGLGLASVAAGASRWRARAAMSRRRGQIRSAP